MLAVYDCLFITTASASFCLLKGDFYFQPSLSQCFSVLKLPNLKTLMAVILVHTFVHTSIIGNSWGKRTLGQKVNSGDVLAQSDLKWSIKPGKRLLLVNVFTKGGN